MKILLVSEASGYHHYLKRGLVELGHEVVHAMPTGQTSQERHADYFFGNEGTGLLSKISRNISPLLKILKFANFDTVNFILGLSTSSGLYTKYLDLPLLHARGVKLSYIGTGCDSFAMLRLRPDKNELPCASCEREDALGRDCAARNLGERVRALHYSNLIDYTITPCFEYEHAHSSFPRAIHRRIPLPIDVGTVPFTPAKCTARPLIVHAPTRRGFKGTSVVLEAMELVRSRGWEFEFRLLEGLPFPKYLKAMTECDVHIDQVLTQSAGIAALESLAMGKIVVSGNGPHARDYFPFGHESPIFHASSDATELANTICRVLSLKERYPKMAAEGRAFVETRHNHVGVAREFVDLWSEPSTAGSHV